MSKRPAVAIAVATGVDWRWLAGSGPERPIPAKLGMTSKEIKSARNEFPHLRALKGQVTGEHGLRRYLSEKELQNKLAAGAPWKKEMADAIQNHKTAIHTDKEEKQLQEYYRVRHLLISRRLAQIIQSAIKLKRGELAIARIEDFIRELAAEPWLRVKAAKPTRR